MAGDNILEVLVVMCKYSDGWDWRSVHHTSYAGIRDARIDSAEARE